MIIFCMCFTYAHTYASQIYVYFFFSHFSFQLNYENLRKCVASGPIPPMSDETWDKMANKLSPHLLRKPVMKSILSDLHQEVVVEYEECLRKLVGT